MKRDGLEMALMIVERDLMRQRSLRDMPAPEADAICGAIYALESVQNKIKAAIHEVSRESF